MEVINIIDNFINKYTYLCDKNHHLLINFGSLLYGNCFNNNLNTKQITDLINYLEENKYSIINNEKGQISVYSNEYLNITNNSITEYTIIDSVIDKNMIIRFTQVNMNKNLCSFENNANYEYDYELVTSELTDGCFIDILKKYHKNDKISYSITISITKPCKVKKYIEEILKIIN
jgi:hypothetical protein